MEYLNKKNVSLCDNSEINIKFTYHILYHAILITKYTHIRTR